MNVDELEKLFTASKYDKNETHFILDGFRNGFSIGYAGPKKVQIQAPNLKLECGTSEDLWGKVMAELQKKRFAGPFLEPPTQYYIQSPIGLVPKDESAKHQIFHLSYPRGGASVNSQTPKELCSIHYKDLDHAIKLCMELGRACFTAKSDMKSAFRNLPIKPGDWKWLTMMAKYPKSGVKYFFVDKC